MKNETPATPSINGVSAHSETQARICKYSKCDKDIEDMPKEYKFCCIEHRQTHYREKHNKSVKKKRICVVCKSKYDFLSRGRKWTCSDKCEKKHKNMQKANGWQKYYTPHGERRCKRCGVIIRAKAHCFCSGCYQINKELMKFKEECRG